MVTALAIGLAVQGATLAAVLGRVWVLGGEVRRLEALNRFLGGKDANDPRPSLRLYRH